MLVCHLSDGSLAGDYFRCIVDGLNRAGEQVLLVDIGTRPPPSWLDEYPNASYAALGASQKLGYITAAFKLTKLVRARRVDILQTHLYYPGLIGAIARKLARRVVLVLMRHHTSVVRMLGSGLHTATDKWMAEQADHVLTVSEAARRYMRDVDGIRRHIEVVHIGLDLDRFTPDNAGRTRVRSEIGFSDNDLVIGYVGNILPGKGHIELIEAFRQVLDVIPQARLLIVGRGLPADVKTAAASLPVGAVTFLGWRDDTAACYNAMDIFVQPSLSEAFSQVLLEAMATGLPTIATDVGGAAEVIDDGSTGLLISPGSPEEISDAIRRLGSDEGLRRELAEAGRNTVRERFPASKMVERHLELYHQWMERNR